MLANSSSKHLTWTGNLPPYSLSALSQSRLNSCEYIIDTTKLKVSSVSEIIIKSAVFLSSRVSSSSSSSFIKSLSSWISKGASLAPHDIRIDFAVFFDGLKKTVRITAEVLGDKAPEIAESYIKELDGNIKFVEERLKGLKDEQRPTVLHITKGSDLLMIDGGKSMIGEWIKLAGGKSVLPDEANMVTVTVESIIQANPDVIIIGSSGNKAQAAIEKIKADPAWQSISAVKNNRIYANPTGTFPWDRYSAEEALQILWAAQLFHPEQFKDLNMVEKTQAFYKKYYGYALSKENAEQILKGLSPIK